MNDFARVFPTEGTTGIWLPKCDRLIEKGCRDGADTGVNRVARRIGVQHVCYLPPAPFAAPRSHVILRLCCEPEPGPDITMDRDALLQSNALLKTTFIRVKRVPMSLIVRHAL